MQINIQDAKTQLSRLIDAALTGEEIIIARAGKPCVRLVALVDAARTPGAAKGKARLTEAFFEPLPEDALRVWNGL